MKKILFFLVLLIAFTGMAQDSIVKASFTQDVLGMGGREFSVAFIWALLGMLINLFSDVTRRKVPSEHSPQKFSIKYWLSDNWRRITLSFLLIPISIISVEQMFGVEMSRFVAFSIGYGSDHLIEIIKRRGVIKGAPSVAE